MIHPLQRGGCHGRTDCVARGWRQGQSQHLRDDPCAHYRYRVLEADNGDEGFWLAFTQQPNLIVVELEVTLRDGHRLTEKLKREPQTASIPVLVVSSWATASDRRLAQRDGRNAYLPKPCTPSRILHEVQRFIGPSEAQAT